MCVFDGLTLRTGPSICISNVTPIILCLFVFFSPPHHHHHPSTPLAAPPSTRPRSPPSACCPLISLPGASVCLTSATSCSSSGNYLAALRCLLIFVSTCRNICFRRVICQRERATLFGSRVLSTFTHAHKALLSPPPTPPTPTPPNACLHCSGKEEKISPARSRYWSYLLLIYSSQ